MKLQEYFCVRRNKNINFIQQFLLSYSTMSLLPSWALNISVALLSMQGLKVCGFHQNIFICVLKMNEGLTGLERHEVE